MTGYNIVILNLYTTAFWITEPCCI